MRRCIALWALVAAACGGSTVDEAALRREIRADIFEELRQSNAARRAQPERRARARVPLPEDTAVRYRVGVEGAPRRGEAAPLVTIVAFSDFQCPFCGRVQPTLDQLLREYPDDVALVFRHNPLPFHQDAMGAAEAAQEVYRQGGDPLFWRYQDLLWANQRALSRADLERYAAQVGADPAEVGRALDSERHRARVQADMDETIALGGRGTPAFFLNGVRLMGAQPIERFREVVDQELAYGRALMERGVSRRQLYAHLMRDARTTAAPEPAHAAPAERPQPDPDAVYRIPTDGRPQLGPDDALVTIVVFTDFQCPFCARLGPTLEQILQHYGADVRIVVRNNPLAFHQRAMPAAEAALEVRAQLGDGGYFAYHALLFENQRELEEPVLLRLAAQIGANRAAVEAALADHRHRAAIEEDQRLVVSVGAVGVPTSFVNGRNLRGAQPFAAFQAVIDEELARAQALVGRGTPRAAVYEALIRDGSTSPQTIPRAAGGPSAPSPSPPSLPDTVYAIPVPPGAPARGGPPDAPVVVQVFSDFQCPFCNRARPILGQIVQRYGPRVRIVWRDYPLPFHGQAMAAAEAAREVFQQVGNPGFWELSDLLFDNQRNLLEDDLVRLAGTVRGVDEGRVRRALIDRRHRAAIEADIEAVESSGARIGTPSFFVNGRLVMGAQPFPAFEAAIDRALAEAAP